MASDQYGHLGLKKPQADATPYDTMNFVFEQLMTKVNTATLVKVLACTNAGGDAAVGFVDVMPLVQQVDGSGNAVAHATIFNVPYMRIQGGVNAVILDPQIGDIGIAVFASRDLSKVKANQSASLPGSPRRFDYADGLYVGGVLNGVPTQYIQFSADGIAIVSPTKISLQAPTIEMNAENITANATDSYAVNAPVITLNGAVGQGSGSYAGTMTLGNDMSVAGKVTAEGGVVDGTVRLATHTHPGDGDPPTSGT